MVKKANGKWRMCTDYTDLNKTCPKDAYPLPHIDALVDGAAGHQRLSFLDAYSGYNQIPMYPPDERKTAFITLSITHNTFDWESRYLSTAHKISTTASSRYRKHHNTRGYLSLYIYIYINTYIAKLQINLTRRIFLTLT
uniref:Transposon Ty3-I Gag-Pol polyprotein n=1 Tax=Cajanus cajan TaxID=3821 RepID=A0A151T2Q3_CAJCA|nr:Transposon Ty3-I Gag-Pol polyprotein [Cajanus cajan]